MHRLSCKRCQFKKLKCSRTEPCHNCFKATIPCEYREVDHKRRPASYDHVVLLQSRISWLEEFITKAQHLGHVERDALLQSFVSLSPASPRQSNQDVSNPSDIGSFNILTLQPGAEGSLSYYGPTSIYRLQSGAEASIRDSGPSASPVESLSNVDHVLDHFGIDIDAQIVSDSLMLFFKWQYPHLMFVYRDAFIRDHLNRRNPGKYWSPALLLSICALGSLLLDDPAARSTSEQFYGAAESIALVTGLTRPSIITVQTFLCLAFYEIGRGNPSKGWAYSGIGFRMAQELGFQKDPKSWISYDFTLTTLEDLEIRRRIYWGCYISDKLISLILGRPVHLDYNDGEVEHLQTQIDLPTIKPWRSVGFDDDEKGNNSMIPYVKEQIKLSRILEKMFRTLFNSQSEFNSIDHRQILDSLNLELHGWKAQLPPWASFNKWDSMACPLKPSLAALLYDHAHGIYLECHKAHKQASVLFHSARIALNFDQGFSVNISNISQTSRDLCLCSADEIFAIVRKVRYQYGLKYSPVVLIYGVVQATRAMGAFRAEEDYSPLEMALTEISSTWQLAEDMKTRISTGFAASG